MKNLAKVMMMVVAIAMLSQGCGAPDDSSETKARWWNRPNPDKVAISKCLAKWGNSPFTADSSFRKVQAAVGWNRGNKVVTDTYTTAQPELVLVPAIVSVFGTVTYQLKNPNGWYCLATTVGVGGTTRVEIPASAHLADSVHVQVGAHDNYPGLVNVNVDGQVEVVVLH